MKTKISNYTFDKTLKTVTFSDYSSIRLDGVLLITNVTSNIIIYNFADPAKGGTVLNNVLTLLYDTSLMNNTDKLLIYYDDYFDGRIIYSGNIIATGAGSSIDTSGYGSITVQLSGIWNGSVDIEISNDGSVWHDCFVLPSDEPSLKDLIDSNGTYSLRLSSRYIRYNCKKITGTIAITISGKISEGLSGADMLSFAMDRTQNMPLQVQLPINLKQEPDGGLILADMKGPIAWNSSTVSQPLIIDCTGYSSVIVHKTTAGIVTPTISNDGILYSGTVCIGAASSAAPAATIPTATGIYIIPVLSKFLKLTGPASAIYCVIYLSQTPYNAISSMLNPPVNITQFGGTTAVTAGLAGTLAVGGNVATGLAPTTNPLQVGGVDDSKIPLTRRFLTDILGRLQISTQTGQSRALNELGYDPNYKNVILIQNVDRGEDNQNSIDLLTQLLTELKILNQYMYELPGLMLQGKPSVDEPASFRNDQSFFKS